MHRDGGLTARPTHLYCPIMQVRAAGGGGGAGAVPAFLVAEAEARLRWRPWDRRMAMGSVGGRGLETVGLGWGGWLSVGGLVAGVRLRRGRVGKKGGGEAKTGACLKMQALPSFSCTCYSSRACASENK